MISYKEKVSLDGEWFFYKKGEEEKYPVTVPGSVLSGCLSNNLIEDPFVGTNEYPTREMLRNDYTFERAFQFEGDKNLNWELVLDGIDTVSDIFLNDKLLVHTDNMHRRYVLNVDKYLVSGDNFLKVSFTSPITYIENAVPSKGKEITFVNTGTIPGSQYIRKAHSMLGWDWGPQLPDMGIWRSIYLRGFEKNVLDYVQIKQIHKKKDEVYITVKGILRNAKGKESLIGYENADKKYALKVSVFDPGGKEIVKDADGLKPIEIQYPEIWWPNRLGDQPLYTVRVTLVKNKDAEWTGNTIEERIGLRTFTVSRENDKYGQEFAFMVNGVKIFAKGADYIPEDCVYSRITKDKIKHLVDSSKQAGFNCLRVWGGGYYPLDEFYDLCDEAGIIVWQDFMFACNIYDLTKDLEASITKEAIDNIRRLRNHAALGLWCGNNENESAWVNWGNFKDHSKALKNDYLKMFENILPKLVEKEDGEHFYWPSSPSSYGAFNDPDSNDVGDRHYWEVWHGLKPFTDYENYFFRFCSEFGFQSFPEMATIKTFAKEGDFNIFSEVMESHQKNGAANGKILHYISENFCYPNSFDSLLYVSQVLQGMAMKCGVEHWRRNRGRCMGSLYWQLNDNWPVASWASIDYNGRWKALHYMARHFYADILGSVQRTGNVFTPYVSNETFKLSDTKVKIYVKTVNNEVIFSSEQRLRAKSFAVETGEAVDISSVIKGREKETYFEAVFEHGDGTVSRQVEPVIQYKHMNLPKTEVNITCKLVDANTVEATVSADKFAAFVNLVCEEENIIWDDNFFFLTGENVTVRGKLMKEVSALPNICVRSICNTYER